MTLLPVEAALPEVVKSIASTEASLPATKLQLKDGAPGRGNRPVNVVPFVTIPPPTNSSPGSLE